MLSSCEAVTSEDAAGQHYALEAIGPAANEAIPQLVELLALGDWAYRSEAATLLGELGDARQLSRSERRLRMPQRVLRAPQTRPWGALKELPVSP